MTISKPAIAGMTIIHNVVAQDETLSYAALGLYVYMKSLPDEEYPRSGIYRAGTGIKGMKNLIKELENAGLLISE